MIKLGTLELASLSSGYLFELLDGGPDDLALWRGEDDVIPEASGRDAGAWIPDTRLVRLHGLVQGDGATQLLRQASYRARMTALLTAMSPGALTTIELGPPLYGLTAGQKLTLADVRPQRIGGAVAMATEQRIVLLELVSIASPPDWVLG